MRTHHLALYKSLIYEFSLCLRHVSSLRVELHRREIIIHFQNAKACSGRGIAVGVLLSYSTVAALPKLVHVVS